MAKAEYFSGNKFNYTGFSTKLGEAADQAHANALTPVLVDAHRQAVGIGQPVPSTFGFGGDPNPRTAAVPRLKQAAEAEARTEDDKKSWMKAKAEAVIPPELFPADAAAGMPSLSQVFESFTREFEERSGRMKELEGLTAGNLTHLQVREYEQHKSALANLFRELQDYNDFFVGLVLEQHKSAGFFAVKTAKEAADSQKKYIEAGVSAFKNSRNELSPPPWPGSACTSVGDMTEAIRERFGFLSGYINAYAVNHQLRNSPAASPGGSINKPADKQDAGSEAEVSLSGVRRPPYVRPGANPAYVRSEISGERYRCEYAHGGTRVDTVSYNRADNGHQGLAYQYLTEPERNLRVALSLADMVRDFMAQGHQDFYVSGKDEDLRRLMYVTLLTLLPPHLHSKIHVTPAFADGKKYVLQNNALKEDPDGRSLKDLVPHMSAILKVPMKGLVAFRSASDISRQKFENELEAKKDTGLDGRLKALDDSKKENELLIYKGLARQVAQLTFSSALSAPDKERLIDNLKRRALELRSDMPDPKPDAFEFAVYKQLIELKAVAYAEGSDDFHAEMENDRSDMHDLLTAVNVGGGSVDAAIANQQRVAAGAKAATARAEAAVVAGGDFAAGGAFAAARVDGNPVTTVDLAMQFFKEQAETLSAQVEAVKQDSAAVPPVVGSTTPVANVVAAATAVHGAVLAAWAVGGTALPAIATVTTPAELQKFIRDMVRGNPVHGVVVAAAGWLPNDEVLFDAFADGEPVTAEQRVEISRAIASMRSKIAALRALAPFAANADAIAELQKVEAHINAVAVENVREQALDANRAAARAAFDGVPAARGVVAPVAIPAHPARNQKELVEQIENVLKQTPPPPGAAGWDAKVAAFQAYAEGGPLPLDKAADIQAVSAQMQALIGHFQTIAAFNTAGNEPTDMLNHFNDRCVMVANRLALDVPVLTHDREDKKLGFYEKVKSWSLPNTSIRPAEAAAALHDSALQPNFVNERIAVLKTEKESMDRAAKAEIAAREQAAKEAEAAKAEEKSKDLPRPGRS